MFLAAGKISLGVFLLYFAVFRAIAYVEYILGLSTMPFPIPGQFLFLPMVVPLIAGYFLLRNKSREEGLAFSGNFMLWALVTFLITGILQSLVPGLFFAGMGYFLAAPLFFSIYSLLGKKSVKFFIVFLLAFLPLAVDAGLITLMLKTLPYPLNLLAAFLFAMRDFLPFPFIGIGLLSNVYLSLYLTYPYPRADTAPE